MKWPLAVVLPFFVAGCAAGDDRAERHPHPGPPPKPQLFGRGPEYFPKPRGARVRSALPVAGMRCSTAETTPRYLAHVEIFLQGRVVLIPKGIGTSPRHRCSYPLRTREPTGIVEVAGAATLGDFFAIWERPIPPGARVYVGHRRVRGRPADVPLHPHSVVTVETGRYVRPHARYVFPP